MKFGEKLKELRTQKGWSEAKLAEECGVPFGTLHHYGVGIRRPTFAAVVKLAKALGVDCTAFAECDDIAGDDTKQPAPKPKVKGKPARGRRKG
jgi:transcriptional regulator with XRE-family HTH domain